MVSLCYCDDSQNSPDAFISLILGKVFIQKSDADHWSRARINQTVVSEDQIRCDKKSRCEIKIGKQQVLRIGELTSIIVKNQINEPEIEVKTGRIWLNIILEGEKLNLRTPTSVASIRGTVYRADADSNATQFRVYEGEVGISTLNDKGEISSDSVFVLTLGQEFVITNDAEKFIEEDKQKQSQFIEDDRSQFEKFLREQEQGFKKYKEIDQGDFKKYQSFQVLQRSFDPELDQKDEWVDWNKGRDNSVKR